MEDISKRIITAIDFLKDGLPFKVGDLHFSIEGKNCLNITGVSLYTDLKNVTRQTSVKELQEIKFLFKEMIEISPEFKKYASDKELKYILDFNYGMGGILICSETNGEVRWLYPELTKPDEK